MLRVIDERGVLRLGLGSAAIGLFGIGLAAQPWHLYAGVGVLVFGSSLVNPATTGLISLYAGAGDQGRVLGIFRSLGALARAFTPLLAGVAFWVSGALSVYVAGALLVGLALVLSRRLPAPVQ